MKHLIRMIRYLFANKYQKKVWRLLALDSNEKFIIQSTLVSIDSSIQSKSTDDKIKVLKSWIEKNIMYVTDEKMFGIDEHWQAPTTTLHNGRGDCEDQHLLLLCLLVHAGVSTDMLRFAIGKVIDGSCLESYHAYALYEWSKGWSRILDTTFIVLTEDTDLFMNGRYAFNRFYCQPDHILTLTY